MLLFIDIKLDKFFILDEGEAVATKENMNFKKQYLTFKKRKIYYETTIKKKIKDNFSIFNNSNLLINALRNFAVRYELDDKKIPKNLFKEFLKGFNESGLYKIADRYKCHSLKDILNGKLSEVNNNYMEVEYLEYHFHLFFQGFFGLLLILYD